MAQRDQLIVALDYAQAADALALVDRIGNDVVYYKVGLELFLNSRGTVLDELKARDKKIFLDLKFHDIPNTVAAACRWAAGLGVDMFNVHASGGAEMMRRARQATDEGAALAGFARPKLIGVTVLTSLDQAALEQIGLAGSPDENVVRLAQLAHQQGLDGVVCSSREAGLIAEAVDQPFTTVCPGIRPVWAQKGDQKRVMTPGEAMKNGVGTIVVGRPITEADDPVAAAKKILAEMGVE
jgi:orotidine-5'-phosphate decarboxylase